MRNSLLAATLFAFCAGPSAWAIDKQIDLPPDTGFVRHPTFRLQADQLVVTFVVYPFGADIYDRRSHSLATEIVFPYLRSEFSPADWDRLNQDNGTPRAKPWIQYKLNTQIDGHPKLIVTVSRPTP